MKTPHPCQLVLVSAVLAFAPRLGASEPQVLAPDLAAVASGDGWTLVSRSAAVIDKDGAPAIRLVGDGGTGFARLENFTLAEGVIEFDARGKNVAQQSFLGVAFHGTDNTTYDAIYFRPFNFKAGDPMRRSRAVQYISHPNHTWDRLRNEHPGRYEQPVAPVPDPDAWFHVRVEVAAISPISRSRRHWKPRRSDRAASAPTQRRNHAMVQNAFIGKTTPPTEPDLVDALGPAKAAWDGFLAQLAAELGADVHEWKSHSPKWGWALRVIRKKRTIVWLSPARAGFEALFLLGEKAMVAARRTNLPQRIVHVLETAPKYPEGTGVRLQVRSPRATGALLKLAGIKVAN